jgi:hypothetical protein
MDPDAARAALGMPSEVLLTVERVEVAYAQASAQSGVPAASDGSAVAGWAGFTGSDQLEEARDLLLRRAKRLPPRGEAIVRLTVLQFFVGGAVLFATALGLMVGWATWYDDIFALIGWFMFAVSIAVSSMLLALLVGLPLRLVPRLRSRWLANGELPIVGVVLSFSAIELLMATASVSTVVDEFGIPYEVRDVNGWALLLAWSIFAFSVAHIVWPLRWTRHDRSRLQSRCMG